MRFSRRSLDEAFRQIQDQGEEDALLIKFALALNAFAFSLSIGTLCYGYFAAENPPTLAQMSPVLLLAGLSGLAVLSLFLALQMRRHWRHLKRSMHSDDMTGISNLACFEEVMEEEIRRAGRYQQPLTLAVLDIDQFTSYNEHFGKKSGNEMLRKFARMMKAAIRFTDTIARYGDDEFCALLPHTGLVGGEKFISRFQLQVSEQLDCTFSAGLTLYRPGEKPVQFIMRSRKALDEAKRSQHKKICCVIGSDDSPSMVQF